MINRGYFISFIISLIMGIIVITYTICYYNNEPQKMIIPSPYDIQEMLNEAEPENPIKVDGIIGSETLDKWERCYNNQCALKTIGE